MPPTLAATLTGVGRDLADRVDALRFGPPVARVYNPTRYAREPHERYLRRWARPGVPTLLLGMNPGPWGMTQTGVPFGEVGLVRDWLGVAGRVERPPQEHPKRPVQGFDCPRSEVSGRRLWGWARERYGRPEEFFARFLVLNYCPLVFLAESGRNLTPDKLPAEARAPLFAACDEALAAVTQVLRPRRIVGIGAFAERRAREALAGRGQDLEFGRVLHPSPASPAANRGWAPQAEEQLRALGAL